MNHNMPLTSEIVLQRLRTLHVYRTYYPDPPGGLQEAIRQIALSTSAVGNIPNIFALSPQPTPRIVLRAEGQVVRARSWVAPASCDIGGIDAFSTYTRSIKQADILHYHFPWPFADLLHILSGAAVPAVMTYHSDIVRQRYLGAFYAPLMWKMMRSMRLIVATSPAYARTSPVLSHPSIRDKVRIIPLGIAEDSYPKQGDPLIFERIGISADEPYFLFIGVLRYYKGLHTLVKAAAQVNGKIVIAGSGPEEESLKALANQLGLSNVIFAGQVTDFEKVALLRSCKALVLPSHMRSEAFGMVLVEASLFGKPMVTCEIGTGTSYVNLHGETGLVIPPENPNELAASMNSIFSDDQLALKYAQGARSRYEQLFSGPALGKAYAGLYKEVVGW